LKPALCRLLSCTPSQSNSNNSDTLTPLIGPTRSPKFSPIQSIAGPSDIIARKHPTKSSPPTNNPNVHSYSTLTLPIGFTYNNTAHTRSEIVSAANETATSAPPTPTDLPPKNRMKSLRSPTSIDSKTRNIHCSRSLGDKPGQTAKPAANSPSLIASPTGTPKLKANASFSDPANF
jgi:hypothetical protein